MAHLYERCRNGMQKLTVDFELQVYNTSQNNCQCIILMVENFSRDAWSECKCRQKINVVLSPVYLAVNLLKFLYSLYASGAIPLFSQFVKRWLERQYNVTASKLPCGDIYNVDTRLMFVISNICLILLDC